MQNIKSIPVQNRRLSIVATEETAKKLSKEIDWGKAFLHYITPYRLPIEFVISLFKKENPFEKYQKKIPYPVFDINIALNNFNFPPQHPKDGIMYACCDIEPDLYVPISTFHNYMYQHKMSAFNEMCASLGAKTCRVRYAEENDIDITAKLNASNIPSQVGILDGGANSSYKNTNKEGLNTYFSFPKPAKPITEYKSNWLNGEPTWVSLQKIRLERDVDRYTAEFNYIDEMGISVDIAASINKIGINIGGTFNKIIKRKFIFDVEFWPKK